jgi:hypothetical protein
MQLKMLIDNPTLGGISRFQVPQTLDLLQAPSSFDRE